MENKTPHGSFGSILLTGTWSHLWFQIPLLSVVIPCWLSIDGAYVLLYLWIEVHFFVFIVQWSDTGNVKISWSANHLYVNPCHFISQSRHTKVHFYPYIYAKATYNTPPRKKKKKKQCQFFRHWPVAFIGKYLPVFPRFIACECHGSVKELLR